MSKDHSGSFRLALIQMRVVGGERTLNLEHARDLIAIAAAEGAQVVLLPETMDLGWTHQSARTLAQPIPDGDTCRALRDAAQRHKLYLCAGLVERDGERVYNAAVFIDPDGVVRHTHRKLNEVTFGHGVYDQGDRLGVIRTPLATFGVMICADGFAVGQVIARTLGYMGADIILSPSAWAVAPDHDNLKNPYGELWRRNYRPVATDFQLWIASVSNVGWYSKPGSDIAQPVIGNSMVFDPNGTEVVTGPHGHDAETILYVDVTPRPRPARACGWEQHWKLPHGGKP